MLQSTEDSPASYFAAQRWSISRRLGLLLRTQFDDEGMTLSLRDISDRTDGHLSVERLRELLADHVQTSVAPTTIDLLAQAFGVTSEFFTADEAVATYIRQIEDDYLAATEGGADQQASLQLKAFAVQLWTDNSEEVVA